MSSRTDQINQAIEQYQSAAPGVFPDRAQYALVRTALHGGGVVSRHRSLRAAVQARIKQMAHTDCECGCCRIIPADHLATLPQASDAPYYYAAR